MTDEGLLTVEEAATYLRLKVRTVQYKAKRGEIPARKVGGHWRFVPAELRSYDEAHQPSKPEQTV